MLLIYTKTALVLASALRRAEVLDLKLMIGALTLSCSVCVLLLFIGVDVGTADVQGIEGSANESMTSYTWKSAPDLSGPAAFALTVDLGEANPCVLIAQGTASGWPGPSLFARHAGKAGVSYGYSEQVHAESLGLDSRPSQREAQPPQATGLRKIADDTFYGEITLTVASPAFQGWLADHPEDPWMPAEFSVECAQPFEVVRMAGSHEVVTFSDQSMQGTGASVFNPPASVSMSAADHAEGVFTAETVEVALWWTWSTPTELVSWKLEAAQETVDWTGLVPYTGSYSYIGGPGDYRFTLNRASVQEYAQLHGWMMAFNDVDSLDHV